ncbi:MAG TPA: RICIN domain-containing protein, partial [Terriglobia bacterium]|nr:RICIN domain-containing protein [Terriglobia bacterium]
MKRSILLFAALAASAMLARAQAPVTQPPEPVDPSPINGETYYLINQLSGLQADLNGSSKSNGGFVNQNTRSFSSLSQRWAVTKLQDGNWKISNISSGLCLDSESNFYQSVVVQDVCGVNAPTQEWSFSYTTNGYNLIRNAGTKRVLDASSPDPGAKLMLSPSFETPKQSQLWLLR